MKRQFNFPTWEHWSFLSGPEFGHKAKKWCLRTVSGVWHPADSNEYDTIYTWQCLRVPKDHKHLNTVFRLWTHIFLITEDLDVLHRITDLAIPENRDMEKMKFSFSCQRHTLSTSFDIFVVTYRVTNFLPKLVDMPLFLRKKLNFHFLKSPIFGYCPQTLKSSAPPASLLRSLLPGFLFPSWTRHSKPFQSLQSGKCWNRHSSILCGLQIVATKNNNLHSPILEFWLFLPSSESHKCPQLLADGTDNNFIRSEIDVKIIFWAAQNAFMTQQKGDSLSTLHSVFCPCGENLFSLNLTSLAVVQISACWHDNSFCTCWNCRKLQWNAKRRKYLSAMSQFIFSCNDGCRYWKGESQGL